MAKKLSNADKKLIIDRFEQDYTRTEIAKELDVPVKLVTDYLLNSIEVANKANEEAKTAAKKAAKPVTAKDLMIRETRERKSKNVAIMTREASEKADLFKQMANDKGEAFKQRYKDAIFTREDKNDQ